MRIEQVRELAAELALTSHQGGYKVGILSPADAFNRFAANALLKTLEEPPPRTLLMLVAIEPSRLPATILSRCQRVASCARRRARNRCNGSRPTRGGRLERRARCAWRGAIPRRRSATVTTIPQLGGETRRTLEELERGAADPVATAERWSRSELGAAPALL